MPHDEKFYFQLLFLQYHYHVYFTTLTDYWPSSVCVCGFWFLPMEWKFSCKKCREISALVSSGHLQRKEELCSAHLDLQTFLKTMSRPPIFVGLSSVGRQGPHLILFRLLVTVNKKFIYH